MGLEDKFVRKVEGWGYPNPFNRHETIIDNAVGIELDAMEEGEVYFKHIRSIAEAKKGNASKVLKKTLKLADDMGVTLVLYAKADRGGGMTTKQLISWYVRNGFVHEGGGDMVRHPKTKLSLGNKMKTISIARDMTILAKRVLNTGD